MVEKLDEKRLGLALGIVAGLCIFFLTILATITSGDFNTGLVDVLRLYAGFHPGYHVTPGGAIVGLIYNFVAGFIIGYLIAWLYNNLEKYFKL